MSEPEYRRLQREELDVLIEWAVAEGWNPGLHDADAFWAADPEGFWGMELAGELIGGASIVSYEGEFGFVGLFIVKPAERAKGLGTRFWNFFIEKLKERLNPGAAMALDGVFAMQAYYARSGFGFTHRNLRMAGLGQPGTTDERVVELGIDAFEAVCAFDRTYFPANRAAFLRPWISPIGGRALGWFEAGCLRGYGVIRPCRVGFKIGPLFAETPQIAEALFVGLSAHAAGQRLFLDIPENNPAAVELAARHGLSEVFGCARMVAGPIPEIPWSRIYGVTTFELG